MIYLFIVFKICNKSNKIVPFTSIITLQYRFIICYICSKSKSMIKKHHILIFFLVTLIFSSCVSKKKFVEMQDGRMRAEEQVRQLTEENIARAARIEAMSDDFESM